MENELLIRASEAGKLMIGGNGITEVQLRRIEELEARKNTPVQLTEVQLRRIEELATRKKSANVEGSPVKPLTDKMEAELYELIEARDNPKPIGVTPKMEEELQGLIAKRDAPPELGGVAKALVLNIWLRREFGYDEPLMTPQLFKGLLCEQDAFALISRQLPAKEFRVKNRDTFRNEFYTGNPDIILRSDGVVEDSKVAWTVKTFVEADITPEYYAQGQVYMHLTGLKQFRLIYVLVDTPAELVLEEHKRFFFKFGADDENPHYTEACEKLDKMHYPSKIIAEEKRIKVFGFEYDPAYIEELNSRVKLAREYYKTLTL